nr:MAG TPA: hypothetical protein [Caudoviricetes sp.]
MFSFDLKFIIASLLFVILVNSYICIFSFFIYSIICIISILSISI